MTPREWLDFLHGESPGYAVVSAIARGRVHSAAFGTDELDRAAQTIEVTAPKGDVYLSVGTYGTKPETGRGTSADVVSVPGVFVDLDCGTEGHSERANGLPNPPDVQTGLQIIEDAELPAPTAVVLSGHGAQLWWRLTRPLVADPEDIARLTVGWSQRLVQVFAEAGFGLDNVGDPARILRPPGTLNWKSDPPKPVEILDRAWWTIGNRYRLDHLQSYCHDVDATALVRVSQGITTPQIMPTDLLDAYTALTPWAAILEPHGWSFVRERGDQQWWLRDGKDEGHSAICGPYAMTVFSETAGLPTGSGHKLTKLRVYALLNHSGDEKAAVRDIMKGLGQ